MIKKKLKTSYIFELSDVTNFSKTENTLAAYRPDIVFHVASYKHVSIMEMNPHEAFRVNVAGTKILAELSVKHNIPRFILISSNKCFNPSGVMSISKRISEMVIQALAGEEKKNTKFIITRFGNVLGSSGSVIPLFSGQIQNGGPVTVTHPDMSRYFITISGACELILETAFMEDEGEIYNFDLGEPVKISDIADKMIKMSGLTPGKDIEIIYTGLRPGEKLHDDNDVNKDIILFPTSNQRISIVEVEDNKFDYTGILQKIDKMHKNLYFFSKKEIIKLMEEIVAIT